MTLATRAQKNGAADWLPAAGRECGAGRIADKGAGVGHQPRRGAVAHSEDVRRVLQSTAEQFWPYFPDRTLPPILVEPQGGPIVLFQRRPQGEYQVRLNTGNMLWAQHAFQFAHEFTHILCNYDATPHRNKWFEESLCELGSLFALRRMAEVWTVQPPYPNWKSYAKALGDYAGERS